MHDDDKPGVRSRVALPESYLRTRIANGSQVLDGIDGRSAPARRYKEISAAIVADLGGPDGLTETQLQLVRSAAGLVCLREKLDAAVLNDEPVKPATYARIVNTLRRVCITLGVERTARDVTPDRTARVIEHLRSGA